ncbi:MAG: M28 family peptidase [Firmicutes bacterium]|nr:M28 family peptidase [Bacillota bacterium]
MEKEMMLRQIKTDLIEICVNTGNRHVGSQGNRDVGEYLAGRMAQAGFQVTMPEFDCIDWEHGEIVLRTGNSPVEAFISPYSPSCELESFLVTAANIDELENKDFTGKIALFHGELCREQIAPRNFEFYNPDEHKRILRALDRKQPLAVIAITSRNPELAGGQYPFPLFEDGDLDIPSVYLTEEEGEKLLSSHSSQVYLKIDSRRISAKGFNVIGSKGGIDQRRIVFCAHYDAKKNTPGALDNGTGVVALLALADMLKGYKGQYGIELLAVNGEDYYAAPGQMNYIASNREQIDRVVLAVNLDGAGYIDGKSSYCCLECDENIKSAAAKAFGNGEQFVTAEPWYQSDHGWFIQYGVPAVAITSEKFMYLTTEITHTPKDSIEKVDLNRISEIACALKDLIKLLNE